MQKSLSSLYENNEMNLSFVEAKGVFGLYFQTTIFSF